MVTCIETTAPARQGLNNREYCYLRFHSLAEIRSFFRKGNRTAAMDNGRRGPLPGEGPPMRNLNVTS